MQPSIPAVAEMFRDLFGFERPPVDAIRCLEHRASVVFVPIPTETGLTIWRADGPVVILPEALLEWMSPRLNWTAAHELGHVILHHPAAPRKSRRVREWEARDFAVEFLMPAEWVWKEVKKLSPHGEPLIARDLGLLKEIFDVSWAFLLIRLDELGIQKRKVSEMFLRAAA